MRNFFKELFQYNHDSNQKLISFMSQDPQRDYGQAIKLLSHVLTVHWIWNSRILPAAFVHGAWETLQISAFSDLDAQNFEKSCLLIDRFDLDQAIDYTNFKGQAYSSSVRDILYHVINHSTYHRGQVATQFRQSGLEPVLTDYIFYKVK